MGYKRIHVGGPTANGWFSLNNVHPSDFMPEDLVFRALELQGLVGFRVKSCNFGYRDEAEAA